MAQKIDSLQQGQMAVLKFVTSGTFDSGSFVETCEFRGMRGEGEGRHAAFVGGNGDEFELYRFQGRWAWGSGARRVSLVKAV